MPMGGDNTIIWPLVLQLILIMINAVFICAEVATITMNDAKLEKLSKSGDRRAIRLAGLMNKPAKFLATTQVCTTFSGFLASAFAANHFSDRLAYVLTNLGIPLSLSALATISIVVITLLLSFVTIVLGELVPRRIAMRNAEFIALNMSYTVYTVAKIFKPIVDLLSFSTDAALRLLRIDPDEKPTKATEEEIRIMVDQGSEKGTIDVEEKEFIHNLFNFDDIITEKIMTHRKDVSMLWMEESDEQWETTIYENRHTFHPICRDSQDNIVGVLNTKDYFRLKERDRDSIMANAVKPPQLVPETIRADILLRDMKRKRNHFAVIMDDYGGMSGIVTINDLLEQLVGDLDDADDADDKPLIEAVDDITWHVAGAADLSDVEEAVGLPLPCDEYDTFAGMVLGLLGNIPEDGSTPHIEEYGLSIRVTLIEDHRLKTAVICKL